MESCIQLLETRVAKHKAAVKHAKCNESTVAEHVWKEQHQMNSLHFTTV